MTPYEFDDDDDDDDPLGSSIPSIRREMEYIARELRGEISFKTTRIIVRSDRYVVQFSRRLAGYGRGPGIHGAPSAVVPNQNYEEEWRILFKRISIFNYSVARGGLGSLKVTYTGDDQQEAKRGTARIKGTCKELGADDIRVLSIGLGKKGLQTVVRFPTFPYVINGKRVLEKIRTMEDKLTKLMY